ncbi:hypothetical protein NFI96_022914, partial [Prochilodus magdalenae]
MSGSVCGAFGRICGTFLTAIVSVEFTMETSGPADVPGESKERKKIQFAVPSTAPTQLDPRQVEMEPYHMTRSRILFFIQLNITCLLFLSGQIRRRRPTPATLFRVADQTSPEDDNSTHQWVVGENGVLKPKRVNPSVYQPPSLKAVQQMAEAQMQKLGVYAHMEEEGEEPLETDEAELLSCTSDSQGEGMRDNRPESSKLMTTERTEEEEEVEEEEEEDETTEDESRNKRVQYMPNPITDVTGFRIIP